MDSFKRKDGIIEIDSFDYNKIKKGLYLFNCDNEKYYFKYISSIENIYNELIAEELAKKYGIENIEYDLASLNDNLGVISKNFIKNGYTYISMDSFLKNNINDDEIDKYNNLDDLFSVLKTEILKKQLLDIFIFDILIANNDRHTLNYGLLDDGNNKVFAPLFDNELMLNYVSIYDCIYGIGVTREDYDFYLDSYSSNDNIIDKAIEKYDIKDRIIDKLYLTDKKNFKDTLDLVEDRIGKKIELSIREKLEYKMNCNNNTLQKRLKI